MLQITTRQASEEGGENDKKADNAAAGVGSGNGKFKDIQFQRRGEVTLSGSMTRQVCGFDLPFFE
jgi:capping protein beta